MMPKLLTTIVLLTLFFHGICKAAGQTPSFPAVFYFGDSTLDTGNNNYISSVIQANHRPYGIEFPGQVPTGRFSSGKLVTDYTSSYLGIKDTVPPYLDPNLSDKDLQTGVSFASGGSGIDDLTGLGQVITMERQIQYFKSYKHRLERIVGRNNATNIVKNSLVIVSAGTNDFALNFYNLPTRRLQFDTNTFQNYLLRRLRRRIQEMHHLGLRTFVVAGLPPLGYIPIQMTVKFRSPLHNRTNWNDEINDALAYNQKLMNLLAFLQKRVPGAIFEYADFYNPMLDMIIHPEIYGFEVVDRGCCGTGLLEAGLLCTETSPMCENPEKYLFWDSIHPSQSAYYYLSRGLQRGFLLKLLQHNN